MYRYKERKEESEEADPEYQEIARYVLSRVDRKAQESVAHVLSSEKTRRTYEILKEENIPKQTIRKMMLHGISHLGRGKPISAGAYATAIVEELTNNDRYREIIDEMYEEGVLSERQYESVKGYLEKHSEKNIRRLSQLEYLAKAAVWIVVSFGFLFMIFSAAGITGAVIGISKASSSIFILGFIMFFIGLLLNENIRKTFK